MRESFPPRDLSAAIVEYLKEIQQAINELKEKEIVREVYSVEEFSKLIGREVFTTREYCRLNRVNAKKKLSGRGRSLEWVITHQELLRYRAEGLLPLQTQVDRKGGDAG
jgi:hypothetical protein